MKNKTALRIDSSCPGLLQWPEKGPVSTRGPPQSRAVCQAGGGVQLSVSSRAVLPPSRSARGIAPLV